MDGGCQLHKNTEKEFNIGQVNFINCLPINLPIELGEIKINAKIINGTPKELNELILKGEIDIAPVSSFTYIQNKDKLTPIADMCIASNGPADSVLLFSKLSLEELHGAKIALSHTSATSNKLLEIVLNEFLNLQCKFEMSPNNESAKLLIGDDALLEFSKGPKDMFVYDLGSLWKKFTGLPMVFGIWVCRKEMFNVGARLIAPLQGAKQSGLNEMFDMVIKKAMDTILISRDFYRGYFEHLSYDLTSEYKKGLEEFEKYCVEKEKIFISI